MIGCVGGRWRGGWGLIWCVERREKGRRKGKGKGGKEGIEIEIGIGIGNFFFFATFTCA